MNRISRGSVTGEGGGGGGGGGRNGPPPTGSQPQQIRRGRGQAGGASRDGEEGLDLFSRTRRGQLIASPNESNVQAKLERVSIGSAKLGRNGTDDLFSADTGKHDYDWLLTPPGTPLYSSSEAQEHPLSSTSQRSSSNARSLSTAKASRFSVPQSEKSPSTRPTKTSSTACPSISSYYSNNSRTSVLNTSSASVNSRPSTPGNRPTNRSVTSRPSTPAKSRPSPNSLGEKPKPISSQNSRPSTPASRSQISNNSNPSLISMQSRPNSRPSTPTRRTPAALATSPAPPTSRSPSVGRAATIRSRPSSPAPRARAPAQPPIPLGFPLDVPPNLRTKLPERSLSTGKQRPGTALTVRTTLNTEAATPATTNRRRSSSPVTTRGRFPDTSPKVRAEINGNEASQPEIQKKSIKPASVKESNGFGRNISKRSLDMALRHMDIRQGMGVRGASLFPQSIRSAAPKSQMGRALEQEAPMVNNGVIVENGNCNGTSSKDYNGAISENGSEAAKSSEGERFTMRAAEVDIYGSSRYDAILLKEDLKNMNWLHSVEDKSDQSPVFDHRFEPLPEPFVLL